MPCLCSQEDAPHSVMCLLAGIVVRFMNGHVEGNGIRDPMSANNLISQVLQSKRTSNVYSNATHCNHAEHIDERIHCATVNLLCSVLTTAFVWKASRQRPQYLCAAMHCLSPSSLVCTACTCYFHVSWLLCMCKVCHIKYAFDSSHFQPLPLYMQVQFTGMTPLGSSLDSKVIRPFLGAGISNRNLQKPILVITITDGEPTGEPQNTVANVIKNAKNMCTSSIYGPNAIAFEFAQVGKDTKAQAFLGRLDTDPEIGKMIDATSYYELEAEEYMRRGVNLTPELWLVKLMVGAVDPTYDEQVSCRPARV